MSDNFDLVSKNADSLTPASRYFYERAIFKTFLSIVYAAIALFFLGLCSQAGGKCNHFVYQAKQAADFNLNDSEDINHYMAIGFGFSCFFYFVAFTIALACAFHISPLTNGSVKERITIRTPIDVDKTV